MPFALTQIPDGLIDTRTPAPQYSADFASIVGNAADNSDGFETIFSDLAAHLADGPNFTTGLDLALSDLGNVGDPMHTPFEQDFADSLHASIASGQGDFDAFAVHLTGNNPPASGGSGGGAAGGTGASNPADCHQRTNKYGLSTLGTFPGVTCNWKMPFQIMRVQDGGCTLSTQIYPPTGQLSWPRVVSFTLQSGDATVWKLGHHQERASDGTLVDLFDITVTPKLLAAPPRNPQAQRIGPGGPPAPPTATQSHFDAVGILVTSNPNKTEHVCMSVDCIP